MNRTLIDMALVLGIAPLALAIDTAGRRLLQRPRRPYDWHRDGLR